MQKENKRVTAVAAAGQTDRQTTPVLYTYYKHVYTRFD